MKRAACALLLLLGIAALYGATRLQFGAARQPETGFFPTLVALALIVFSGLALAERPGHFEPEARSATGRTWIVIAAVAAYAALVQAVGFVICTAVLLILLLRAIGQRSWFASLAVSVLAAVGCYALFTRLGMPLPAGVLGV